MRRRDGCGRFVRTTPKFDEGDKRRVGECLIWLGPALPNGYGRCTEGLTHRVALERKLGKPLGRLFALHTCDTYLCIEPTHLFPGTQAENLADARAKGRMPQAAPGWRLSPAHRAKISINQTGRRASLATRARMSASQSARQLRIREERHAK